VLVKACLNGTRRAAEHPSVPIDAEALARDAVRVAAMGAGAVHIHPRDGKGYETLSADAHEQVISAVREGCPGMPIGVSTAAWIVPGWEQRLEAVAAWSVLPDFASVNISEVGALQVLDALLERGIEVEAGLAKERDARIFVEEGLDSAVLRILVEIDDDIDPEEAVRRAAAIDTVLDDGLVEAPRLHHGSGMGTWSVIHAALQRGHDVRIGLEDTLMLQNGERAHDNAALVHEVVAMARAAGRVVDSLI
jgi:uncharacterized protein (DUF849 family)